MARIVRQRDVLGWPTVLFVWTERFPQVSDCECWNQGSSRKTGTVGPLLLISCPKSHSSQVSEPVLHLWDLDPDTASIRLSHLSLHLKWLEVWSELRLASGQLKICFSNKIPGDADAAGPHPTRRPAVVSCLPSSAFVTLLRIHVAGEVPQRQGPAGGRGCSWMGRQRLIRTLDCRPQWPQLCSHIAAVG